MNLFNKIALSITLLSSLCCVSIYSMYMYSGRPQNVPGMDMDIFKAIEFGNLAQVQMLIAEDHAVVNRPGRITGFHDANYHYNKTGATPLILAAMKEDPKIVQALINAGADVNYRDNAGHSPLSVASIGNNIEVVELLIKARADVNLPDKLGNTPLHLVRNPEIAKLLIKNGADTNMRGPLGETPLERANLDNRWAVANVLKQYATHKALALGKHPHLGEQSPVALVGSDVLKRVALLANWNIFDAIDTNNLNMVQELINADPSVVNQQNSFGDTPLHQAVYRRSPKIVQIILQANPDLGLRNTQGKTPLQWAITSGQTEIVDLIQEHIQQRQQEIRRATAAATHPRLGAQSPASLVGQDVLRQITQQAEQAELEDQE